MWWPFKKKKPVEWIIQPQDVHLNSSEYQMTLKDGWEPYGVTPVPNTLDQNQIRVWLRRPINFKKSKDRVIRIQSAGWGGHEVLLHLTQFWTPFGVSMSFDNHIIWFWKDA